MAPTWPRRLSRASSKRSGAKTPENSVTVKARDDHRYTVGAYVSRACARTPTPMPRNIRYTQARISAKPQTRKLANDESERSFDGHSSGSTNVSK